MNNHKRRAEDLTTTYRFAPALNCAAYRLLCKIPIDSARLIACARTYDRRGKESSYEAYKVKLAGMDRSLTWKFTSVHTDNLPPTHRYNSLDYSGFIGRSTIEVRLPDDTGLLTFSSLHFDELLLLPEEGKLSDTPLYLKVHAAYLRTPANDEDGFRYSAERLDMKRLEEYLTGLTNKPKEQQ